MRNAINRVSDGFYNRPMNKELEQHFETLKLIDIDMTVKSKNLIYLLMSTFLVTFGIGFFKFHAVTFLCQSSYELQDKEWIIQLVGALMTIGPVLVYVISGPLAATFQKRWVMFCAAGLTTVYLTFGAASGWMLSVWFYLLLVGLSTGVFSVAKMALVPIEAKDSGKTTTSVNGVLSIAFIVGMLSGITCGTWLTTNVPDLARTLVPVIFLAGALPCMGIHYSKEEKQPFKKAQSLLLKDSITLLGRYPMYLFSTPLIWGIAGALSLAVTAYAEILELGTAYLCSLMSLYAAVGIIAGTVISNKLHENKYKASAISCLSMVVLMGCLPWLVELSLTISGSTNLTYGVVSVYMVVMGVLFGICTNLIDSTFLEKVAEDKLESAGAALQSAAISLFSFLVGGSAFLAIWFKWVSSSTQFYLLTALSCLALVLILLLAIRENQMNSILARCISTLIYFALKLRYRIRFIGLEKLPRDLKSTLFLPNHPAEIDPVIIGASLWKKAHPRPVVVETFYEMPVVKQVMKLMKAFSMPDLETGSGFYKKKKIQYALENIEKALHEQSNVLIYPAGKLMRSGVEELGGASGVYSLLGKVPQASVVLVRTRGLWGSSFSTAQTEGVTPDLLHVARHAVKVLLKNLVFFCPRRTVEVEFKWVDRKSLEAETVGEFNKKLENFYNEKGEEPCQQVPYQHWGNKNLTSAKGTTRSVYSEDDFDEEEVRLFLNKFSRAFVSDGKKPELHTRLAEDMGMDSLLKSEVLLWLEEKYELSDIEPHQFKTCGDILYLIKNPPAKNKSEDENQVTESWFEKHRPGVELSSAETLQEGFLKNCDRLETSAAICDELNGVLKWKSLKLAALLMAREIRNMPGQHIGVMLPASVSANIVSMGVLLAGKTPVMLNWTTGRRNLEHAVQVCNLEVILTAGAFLDKLSLNELGKCEEKLVLLEWLKEHKFGLAEKLVAWLDSRKETKKLMRDLDLNKVSKDDQAVILFTSGSESAPKGVPLTHENVMTNLKGAVEVLPMGGEDVIFGFLPPFHSFGFTVTSMLPMLTGIKAVYHPNPTENKRIVQGLHKWGATLLCGTPTFINGILKTSTAEQLKNMKYFVAGAEKCPEGTKQKVKEMCPGASILEGYGITECGPVISMCRPEREQRGVGLPFPGVDVKIVDPELHHSRQRGESGLILVRGKNVFKGYLNSDNDPFLNCDGEIWYNTGDLGYLDDNGCLVLEGRMKRFVKIAGEMISLPAMESVLNDTWPTREEGPAHAIQAIESEGERSRMFLYTTIDLDLNKVNDCLRKAGFSNVSRLSAVHVLGEIPLLGTGKIDYQALKADMEQKLAS